MMQLEVNSEVVKDNAPISLNSGGVVMVTPPISGGYWLARVRVTQRQAVVCFPKFGTIGVGFQRETDWNTNLPYTCDAVDIYDHIKGNKGRNKATRDECIAAIKLIQQFAQRFKEGAGGNQAAMEPAKTTSASEAK